MITVEKRICVEVGVVFLSVGTCRKLGPAFMRELLENQFIQSLQLFTGPVSIRIGTASSFKHFDFAVLLLNPPSNAFRESFVRSRFWPRLLDCPP